MNLSLQDSIVLINSKDITNNRFGTSFAIFRDEDALYLLTCAHVVDDVGGVEQVIAGGLQASVVVCGERENPDLDSYNPVDLAVLKVDELPEQPVLNCCPVGFKEMPFMTAGFQAFSKSFLIRPLQGSLGEQVGLESRKSGNRVRAWDLKICDDYGLKPGYSGSPVVSLDKRCVLGVVSHRQGENKGVAISIDALTTIWPDIPFDMHNSLTDTHLAKDKTTQAITSHRQRRKGKTVERLQSDWERYNSIVDRLKAALAGMGEGLSKIQLEKEIQTQEAQLTKIEEELAELDSESE